MATDEQIKAVVNQMFAEHFRGRIRQGGKTGGQVMRHPRLRMLPDWQDVLFCPQCSKRATLIFGGHHVYFFTRQGVRRQQQIKIFSDLVTQGKSKEEIMTIMAISKETYKTILYRLNAKTRVDAKRKERAAVEYDLYNKRRQSSGK